MLELKNISYFYKSQKDKMVLDQISYQFEKGKMYAILGASGSGKTTLLSLLAGLDSPISGEIDMNGENIEEKGLATYRPLRHFRANSPFNYKKKCLLYFPPRVKMQMDNRKMAEEIVRLVGACHGHALVLFTAYRQMAEVRALTDGQWPYPTYQAWRNGGKIIQKFKQSGNGVLFAAGSCWEGIDFPGDMVSLLIIAKLPFPMIDRILVKSASRMARNTVDLLTLVRELKSIGVTVQFEKEQFDTDSATGEMMLSMMCAIAQEESLSISKNMKWGIRKKMQAGTYVNCATPFGYRQQDHQLVLEKDEAAVVRLVFEKYLSGVGIAEIARYLNENHPKEGGWWYTSAVRFMLHNEAYQEA